MERKLSLRGNVDMLNGPIFKSLVVFAIPILFSTLFQQLYNTVDTMIVGHFLGEASLAAIGASTSIYDLLVGFALGIGNGLAIVTGRSYGSKDVELLKKSVATSIVIGICMSFIISIAGSAFLMPLLEALHTPSEIILESYSYISIIAMSVIVMFAYNLCAGLMRAIGNSFMPLIFLIVSSVLNVVLDLLLITQFHMGIAGAAIATVIAQGISVILCVIYIQSKCTILKPERGHFHVDVPLYKEMLAQGLSMGFMSSIVACGSVILQYGINNLGYLIIAGHTAARKLYMFFNMFFIAMAQAISTFVSQNKGANQPQRIKKAIHYAYLYNLVLAVIVTLVLWIFAPLLVELISGSKEAVVLNNGAMYLRIVGPFYAILGALFDTRFALQGLGMKILPLISSVIELVGKIIFVVVLIPRFDYWAVIFCEPVIWCFMTVQLVITFYTNPFIKEAK